ncbi:MAG TPA: ATP-dependent helicase C-terminal domain-containing protein [Polyangiaceae bacterium LLY-WYZ-14_1]|nr:ATP-dependent helicase C-terminal domain-containing protein [Polyangiaceae bacterium LLY-WYZ-14_1]
MRAVAALPGLPIDPHLSGLVDDLRRRRGLVLVAEPGAGKTTRLPRALLDAGVAPGGEIWVTQPRRIAARLAAARVAEELGEAVGGTIGYQVRFEERVSRRTRVRFVTEGILIRRLIADPALGGIGAVLLDELHERHLDADLALGLLREAREGPRPDLLIGAMSATLAAEPVAAFLDAPARFVEGRPHPVEVTHADGTDDRPLERRVVAAVRHLLLSGKASGDVLVFLPGAAEIRGAREALGETAAAQGVELVVLHGELSPREQDRAVRPDGPQRVVLSTNVAETSVTLPRVTAVVDSGLARVARHSPWSGLSTLVTDPISQASAAQRAGRAGRTGPGHCLRLYDQHDHDQRPLRAAPEISRADLAGLVLTLAARGRTVAAFPFLDPPPRPAVEAATETLVRLGAIDEGGEATERGRRLLRVPLHPRLARLAEEATRRGLGDRGCLAAALLAERELRLDLRAGPRSDGGGAHRRGPTRSGPSDVLARVEAFEAAERDGLSASSLRAHRLDPGVVRVVDRARGRIARALEDAGVAPDPAMPVPASLEAEEAALGLAVLAGFPDRVARRRRPGGREVLLAGGGGGGRLAEESEVDQGELLVAVDAEVGRGGNVVVRMASSIEPEALLELFPERLEDRVEVTWDPDRDRVEVFRTLRYDGLVLDRAAVRDPEGDAGIPPGALARVLVDAAFDRGIEHLVDADALEALRRRVAFTAAHLPAPVERGDGPGGRRSLDDGLLRQAVAAVAEGRRRLAELDGDTILAAAVGLLDPELAGALDRLAPSHLAIPGRRRVPVDYPPAAEAGVTPPAIGSRLQDFFGATTGPAVADGQVPVVLHLHAPNGRAVQVTDDLAGFWERHYPRVRKELMRRYPRHAWPDDPRSAAPSRPGRRGGPAPTDPRAGKAGRRR